MDDYDATQSLANDLLLAVDSEPFRAGTRDEAVPHHFDATDALNEFELI